MEDRNPNRDDQTMEIEVEDTEVEVVVEGEGGIYFEMKAFVSCIFFLLLNCCFL